MEIQGSPDKQSVSDIIRCIHDGKNFLITTHINPDGDCISSVLVFAALLEHFEKPYRILIDDDIPHKFRFLQQTDKIETYSSDLPMAEEEVVVVLDASNMERVGNVRNMIGSGQKMINIDHHPGNDGYGDYNIVDPRESSTIEIVYRLIDACCIEPSREVATLVYMGIMADTGRFLFPNTTERSLRLCAEMVKYGASPDEIATQLYFKKTPETIRSLSEALSTLQLHFDGRVATSHFTVWELCDGKRIDTEGFIDYLLMIEGVEVAFFILQKQKGVFRVSFRSKNHVDVNRIAGRFGGGGHKRASGCTMQGPVETIQAQILEILKESF